MLRVRFVLVALVIGVFCVLASPVQATIIWDFNNPPGLPPTIADVNNAGGLRVGDKVFSQFTVVPTQLNTAIVPDETAIRLTGVFLAGELGLRFDGLWQATGGQLADTVIIFKVVADNPYLLTDNTLKMSAYLADNGGSVTISESVYARNPNVYNDPSIAHKEVYSTDYATKEFDHQEFADEQGAPLALPEIWVVKDVGASGGLLPGGIASISSFYQTFSQIPEPATMSIMFVGAAALAARRRRGK